MILALQRLMRRAPPESTQGGRARLSLQKPIHQVVLTATGMPLFDNLDLEAVAAEAARRNRREFLLMAAPLAVETGTGSPLNPLAVF